MATIQPKGKTQNKRFSFYAPSELIDEFLRKKETLDSNGMVVDMTEDFVKILKDTIKQMDKQMDKQIAELPENEGRGNPPQNNQQSQA